MVEPLRHRQTKEAATDMLDLKSPRHTSTLPKPVKLRTSKCFPVLPQQPTLRGGASTPDTCHLQTHTLQQQDLFGR